MKKLKLLYLIIFIAFQTIFIKAMENPGYLDLIKETGDDYTNFLSLFNDNQDNENENKQIEYDFNNADILNNVELGPQNESTLNSAIDLDQQNYIDVENEETDENILDDSTKTKKQKKFNCRFPNCKKKSTSINGLKQHHLRNHLDTLIYSCGHKECKNKEIISYISYRTHHNKNHGAFGKCSDTECTKQDKQNFDRYKDFRQLKKLNPLLFEPDKLTPELIAEIEKNKRSIDSPDKTNRKRQKKDI